MGGTVFEMVGTVFGMIGTNHAHTNNHSNIHYRVLTVMFVHNKDEFFSKYEETTFGVLQHKHKRLVKCIDGNGVPVPAHRL
jgi:hypothetical protein